MPLQFVLGYDMHDIRTPPTLSHDWATPPYQARTTTLIAPSPTRMLISHRTYDMRYKWHPGLWTENRSRFFRSVFLGSSRPKTDFFQSVFRLPKKDRPEKPTRFFRSFLFPVPYANNTYIDTCMETRYVWIALWPTLTAARSRAARHRSNVLPYTGIGIMTSYPLPGLYTRYDLVWTIYNRN